MFHYSLKEHFKISLFLWTNKKKLHTSSANQSVFDPFRGHRVQKCMGDALGDFSGHIRHEDSAKLQQNSFRFLHCLSMQ